jgi:hypothetical protein
MTSAHENSFLTPGCETVAAVGDRGLSKNDRRSEAAATVHAVTSERDVFDFVGLPFAEPWERI